MSHNVVVMTVKGLPHLTEKCIRTMYATSTPEEVLELVVADATVDSEEMVSVSNLNEWFPSRRSRRVWVPNTNISEGWNLGIDTYVHNRIGHIKPDETNIWLVNNDVEFRKPGWMTLLADRLAVPGTGLVGSTAMSVFGLGFATGGIWGFRYDVAMKVAENGLILDENFSLSCQDVDLSVRIAKAGWTVTHMPDIEWGPDPYLVHALSQTGLQHHNERDLIKLREPERRYLIDKHGRNDGKVGYEDVVEIQ